MKPATTETNLENVFTKNKTDTYCFHLYEILEKTVVSDSRVGVGGEGELTSAGDLWG